MIGRRNVMTLNEPIKKNLGVTVLLDYYGDLLTEKQRDVLYCYYNEDLSLSEIADNYSISRQCVHDTIKNAESRLLDLEKKIGLVDKIGQVKSFKTFLNEKIVFLEKKNRDSFQSEQISDLVIEIKDALNDFMQGEC